MDLLWVDSHAHLDMDDFKEDRDQVVQRAFRNNIEAILCPADILEPRSVEIILNLVEKHRSIIAAAGLHPHNAKSLSSEHLQRIEALATARKIRAVGEIGLDFHYNFSSHKEQKEALRRQLHVAQKLDLPLILHSRKSGKDMVEMIEDEHFSKGGIVHCFTENWETARKMMDHGFFISFSGIITFPKAHSLREVARKIPLEKLLVETDSPYLVPFPHKKKNKRNEPAFVAEVGKALAEIKNVPPEELAEITRNNFHSLFMFEI